MKKALFLFLFILFASGYSQGINTDSLDLELPAPGYSGEFSIGFNYDFLMSPLRVSFDYPKGYLGLNVPLRYSMPENMAQDLTSGISDQFSEGEVFSPKLSAKQYANSTIKVDVPMLGGVLSFANIQMMHFEYSNLISLPQLEVGTGSSGDIGLYLKGIANIPLSFSMGWESMVFGYAFQVNDKLKFALNIQRHVFNFDVKGKIDIDILGGYSVTMSDATTGDYTMNGDLDYSLHNVVDGHYSLTKLTPSFAIQYWRFGWISRFGINGHPKGELKAKYSVPFFLDPETFTMANMDQNYMVDNLQKFLNNETNDVEYSTTKDMVWKLPQSHTILFDIVPEKLTISYSKLFGNVEMDLFDPLSDKAALTDTTNYPDTLDFRFKANVDNVIMLHGNFWNTFFSLGVMSLDFSFRDRENLLSSSETFSKLKFGNGVLMPVLNLGAYAGSKIQVLGELDVFPFVALKTGIVYYF